MYEIFSQINFISIREVRERKEQNCQHAYVTHGLKEFPTMHALPIYFSLCNIIQRDLST